MKTITKNQITKAWGLALALAATVAGVVNAADEAKPMKPMKGGEHLIMLNKVETKAEADSLKTGDTLAMVCAKCKTVYITRIKQGIKGAQLLNEGGHAKELIGTHACAGCKSTLVVTGHRIDKKEVLKHSCNSCGDESAFCCATKQGGSTKEPGADKK